MDSCSRQHARKLLEWLMTRGTIKALCLLYCSWACALIVVLEGALVRLLYFCDVTTISLSFFAVGLFAVYWTFLCSKDRACH